MAFIIRLAYIQLVATNHFSKYDIDLVQESIKQRTQTFTLQSGRGTFTDRNGKPLSVEYHPSLILFPFLKEIVWPIELVAEIISISPDEMLTQIEDNTSPFLFLAGSEPIKLNEEQMKKINDLKIHGVFAHYVETRIENVAPHLIGVTGENTTEALKRYSKQVENGLFSVHNEIGVSGLQRALDPFLVSRGDAYLAYYVDNLGTPLFGYDVKYVAPADPYSPTEIVTTIDKDIQLFATKTLEQVGITDGGIVLLDIETNDLLSLVSLPVYDVAFPFGHGAINNMVTTQTPGSIFKIVVAAATIDYNATNNSEKFNCSRNMYDDGEDARQLGLLNFKDSFSQSCNYTFAQLATNLLEKDEHILDKYASKLGLTDPVGWTGNVYRLESVKHFPEEENGIVIKDRIDISDKRAIAQTAIGQNNVRITPIAVANMFATIARGGEKKQVRSVSKIIYENGTTLFHFPLQNHSNDEKVSRYTAIRLQELLRLVVSEKKGTGHTFLANSPYSVAGKSGTAQKGLYNNKMNHWFAGYFPAENPKYAMVIVDLDHQHGSNKTMRAYQQMVQFLFDHDHNT